MEEEGIEQEIQLQPEMAIVGAVYSVNGQTGHVVLTTSDLENTSDYQTSSDVNNAIGEHNADEEAHPYIQGLIDGKQDTLTAGNNIQISAENVISATDTTYSAGNGLNLSSSNEFSVNTTVVATQNDLSNEVTNRENADIALQGQIDAISASSDVVDIVGTYQDLQNYDTQNLKDNDIIKVLQDSTQNNATTYYRWSTSTNTFTLIGQEGPYYTKAAADAQFVPQTRTINSKALSANITLTASDVSALGTSDIVQTTGSSTSQVMSQNAVTTELNKKLNITDYVVDDELADSTNPVQNRVLNNLFGDMSSDFFSGSATSSDSGTKLQFTNAININNVQLNGDTTQQTYSGKNLLSVGVANGSIWSRNVNTITWVGTYTGSNTYAFLDSGSAPYPALPTPVPAGTYTLSIKSAIPIGLQIMWRDADGIITNSLISAGDTSITFSLERTATEFRTIVTEITPGDTYNVIIDNIMLESGSTVSSYEPYVGGIASPNPDYPQDVNVVTGTQSVWVHGKNLIDNANTNYIFSNVDNQYNTVTSTSTGLRYKTTYQGGYPVVYFKVLDATQYIGKVVRLKANFDAGEIRIVRMDVSGGNRSMVGYTSVSGETISYTIPNDLGDASYIGFGFAIPGPSSVDFNDLIMTVDDENITYEPYQSATYTIDLGATELCKIGTYQDYIYKSGNDWYVHKETSKIIFDGTQDWYSGGDGSMRIGLSPEAVRGSSSNNPVISDRYVARYTTSINNSLFLSSVTSQLGIVDQVNGTTPSNFKTWVSTHNTTVYYALATATDTQITDSTLVGQLNALASAPCYSETNIVISATGTNLPSPLDVTVINANANGIIEKLRNS